MKRFKGSLAAALLAATVGIAWLAVSCDGADPLAPYRAELRVGFANEPPYSFRNAAGDVRGEAPEAVKFAASSLGLGNIRWVIMDFGALLGELEAGRIDVIAAGMFITPQRAARVRFSRATVVVGQGLLVPAGNPLGLHSYEDVVRSGKARAAVLNGAVEEEMLARLGLAPARRYPVNEVGAALAALRHGLADCLALSGPTVRYLAGNSEGRFDPADPFAQPSLQGFGPGRCALAFRKSDKYLADAFDEALAAYVGSQEHLARIQPLGVTVVNLPVGGG
ncbi:putative amino-acid-binding protein YxeM [Fundidesulfovibrio magnetotacticus]|uniref:Putative amino-acid-binding protein YxeM n=1 Tax=Fundidesulfovibrio magnetotacticus TaxID=2730080 RepID=A0A6V8LWP7_9BACT|nr:transporter substrate-binding domain-containing protein [Fundidesulfovibrio magnetotacticus]GFK94087.1 putative amino-acid-binding protein YxeM [Fundidesulfovibrio magnetotacticus]